MRKTSLKTLTLLCCALLGGLGVLSAGAAVQLNTDHPDRYVVQKGDTLWDIAGRFLRSPWRWPDIWHVNPQVANPHLIYPGDELELVYIDGQPRLQLRRGGERVVKLSPRVRSRPWDDAIPTIPVSAIAPFLSRPYALDEELGDEAPYIVAFADEHIIGGSDQTAYVRNLAAELEARYHIVRPGDAYRDAETDEILAYEALYIGNGILKRTGDPASVLLTAADLETKTGDRLLPVTQDQPMFHFQPHAPAEAVNGAIIAVMNGVSQIGQYNIVVLDRGRADGLVPGTVLRVLQRGKRVPDSFTRNAWDKVTLPDEEAGLLMVFRSFERISFGLVMHATRAMHVRDKVTNP